MNKKYAAALATAAMVATSLLGTAALADTTAPVAQPAAGQTAAHMQAPRGKFGMNGQRAVIGTVASVSGTTITVTAKTSPKKGDTAAAATSATYTVDASKATVKKANADSSVSAIAVGDTVMVMGATTGTNVAATSIMDGFAKMGPRTGGGANDMMTNPVFTGNGQPVVAGSVTAISGNTLTITNKSNVTYTIDATSAKVEKDNAASAVTNIAVGDSIVAQGTVNGTSVTASSIIDQAAQPAVSGTTGTQTAPKKGFLGAIGGFFAHIFGF